MQTDEQLFAASGRRIWRISATMTGTVAAVGLAAAGWRWAAGFLCGAALSAGSFWAIYRAVVSLGAADAAPDRRPSTAILSGMRFLLLGGIAYVILRIQFVSFSALLWGLFAVTGAVLLEILFQLIYART